MANSPLPQSAVSKKSMGQFFTVDPQIQRLVRRLSTPSLGHRWLEPSAGAGDLVQRKSGDQRPLILVEFDQAHSTRLSQKFPHAVVHHACFFSAPLTVGGFGSIVGNPPYVAWSSFKSRASAELTAYVEQHGFGGKTNLVYPFLDRSARLLASPGELIMVVPKDFASASSAAPLRSYLANHGKFTHWIDCGETKHFPDAQLESLVVFRWEKTGKASTGTVTTQVAQGVMEALAGHWSAHEEVYCGVDRVLFFLPTGLTQRIGPHVVGDFFDVLVSSVTGFDAAFKTPAGLLHLPEATLFQAGAGAPLSFLNTNDIQDLAEVDPLLRAHLLQHETALRARHGADSTRWWQWATIRNAHVTMTSKSKRARIFVLSQTRKDPFCVGKTIGFVGSVYGMFPRIQTKKADLKYAVRILNSALYRDLYRASGLGVDDKFRCSPRSLSMVPFPEPGRWKDLASQLAP